LRGRRGVGGMFDVGDMFCEILLAALSSCLRMRHVT
jgi:hypothetical protein